MVFHFGDVCLVVEKHRAVRGNVGYAVFKGAVDICVELFKAFYVKFGSRVVHCCRKQHCLLLQLAAEQLLLLCVGNPKHQRNGRNYSYQRHKKSAAKNSFCHDLPFLYGDLFVGDCLVSDAAYCFYHAAAFAEFKAQGADMYVYGAAFPVEIVAPDL